VTNKKKKNEITIHSSAAEYLTYVAAAGGDKRSYEMRYEAENIWLTQKMMAALYDVSVPAINQHLKRVYDDRELERGATIKKYLIVQNEGGRNVSREVEHYNLQAIIAVGFKINNDHAVRFRKWAGQIVKDYTIQGCTEAKMQLTPRWSTSGRCFVPIARTFRKVFFAWRNADSMARIAGCEAERQND